MTYFARAFHLVAGLIVASFVVTACESSPSTKKTDHSDGILSYVLPQTTSQPVYGAESKKYVIRK